MVPEKVTVMGPDDWSRLGEPWTCTPWKINMKPTNHPFRKDNELPNLHDYVYRRVSCFRCLLVLVFLRLSRRHPLVFFGHPQAETYEVGKVWSWIPTKGGTL